MTARRTMLRWQRPRSDAKKAMIAFRQILHSQGEGGNPRRNIKRRDALVGGGNAAHLTPLEVVKYG